MNKKQVTMQMIADELGVSKGVVSKALADKFDVSDEIKLKVKATACNIGYVLDSKKKNNSRKRTVSLIAESHCFMPLNVFWNLFITSIENRLNIHGYRVNYIILPKGFDIKNENGIFHKDRSHGIIAILSDAETAQYILANKKPAVFVDPREDFYFEHVRIMASNKVTGYSATKHLIDKGHKKIAFVGNKNISFSFRERLFGFKECIAAHPGVIGVDLHDEISNLEDYYSTGKFEALIADRDITGAVCANDHIALSLYRFLHTHGIKIGEEVSVLGIDDMHDSRFANPPLTTMHIPRREMGECAADIIIKMIEDGSVIAGMEYKSTLIERESVKDMTK